MLPAAHFVCLLAFYPTCSSPHFLACAQPRGLSHPFTVSLPAWTWLSKPVILMVKTHDVQWSWRPQIRWNALEKIYFKTKNVEIHWAYQNDFSLFFFLKQVLLEIICCNSLLVVQRSTSRAMYFAMQWFYINHSLLLCHLCYCHQTGV